MGGEHQTGAAALRFQAVGKVFPGVRALHDVSFSVAAGSVHALCGENGAGKSSLARILAGIDAPDSGHFEVFGKAVRFRSPREALSEGIGMVHQELSFCENLSVADNLCLGSLPRQGLFVDQAATEKRAKEMLRAIDDAIDVRATLGGLSLGQRQMVQIAGAVGAGARVIVFDEPTSSLSQMEAERLYRLIEGLRGQGVTSVFVSHRMDEIFRLCDAVTVLRDGGHVATRPLSSCDEAGLVEMMIGRPMEPEGSGALKGPAREVILQVSALSSPPKFLDISFTLRAGEVLGLAGLVGAGRSEIALALFGLDPASTGRIEIDGRRVEVDSPRDAMAAGLGLVPEDRKRQGLVMSMSAQANTTLALLERLSRLTFIRRNAEREVTAAYFERLCIRAPGFEAPVAGLSGGNQQKVVLARWLAARSRILILDEPTRGVDVGAKAEIHGLIDQFARDGLAVLLISSDLPEILRLSSRILVVRGGRIAGEIAGADATAEAVLRLMAGLEAFDLPGAHAGRA